MRIGIVQMKVGHDRDANIDRAVRGVQSLASAGTDLVVLPEMFVSPYDVNCFPSYAEEYGGPACTAMSGVAREEKVYLVAGSIPEREGDRLYNTSFVFDPEGNLIARHRKVHLFDIAVEGGQHFQESAVLSAGDSLTVFDCPLGKIAVCICFDIRFQELAYAASAAGAQLLVVPGAFNMTTGPAHWELHFRARAVDNQFFTVGVAPARDPDSDYISWAHSIVCDPWGRVIHDSGETECDQVVDIDLAQVDSVRRQLPILTARRLHPVVLDFS